LEPAAVAAEGRRAEPDQTLAMLLTGAQVAAAVVA